MKGRPKKSRGRLCLGGNQKEGFTGEGERRVDTLLRQIKPRLD